jgi:hypothetical protein
MTYGRVRIASHEHTPHRAVVSHSAELVRGELLGERPPHPPFGHLLPKGEGFSRTLRETQDRTSARKTHAKTSFSAVA